MTVHLARQAVVISIVAILGSGAAFANSLSVEPGSLEGSNVAVVALDGGTDKTYVVSNHPTDEKKMTIRFLVDPTPIVCTSKNDRVRVIQASQTGPNRSVVRLAIKCTKNPAKFRAIFDALRTNGGKVRAGNIRVRAGDEVTIEWCASSVGNSADAVARLYINGELKGEATGFSANLEVDKVLLGLIKASSGMTGEYYLDDYSSFSS